VAARDTLSGFGRTEVAGAVGGERVGMGGVAAGGYLQRKRSHRSQDY
jgi:hypothetical protein